MKHRLLLIAFLALPLSAFGEGGLPDRPYLYVQGKAEIEKAPDIVTFRFSAVARNADQTKANQEVQAKAGKIFAFLNEKKIATDDVIASDLTSEPQLEKEEGTTRTRGKIIGYSVTRTFQVQVRDLPAFPKLADDLIGIAGVEFSGIDPQFSKEKETQHEISDKAFADAREQGEKTLNALGMKIDSVFAVSPVAFPEISRQMFGRNDVTDRVIVTGSYMPAEAGRSEYRLGPLTISQTVHIIYLISPR